MKFIQSTPQGAIKANPVFGWYMRALMHTFVLLLIQLPRGYDKLGNYNCHPSTTLM